MRILLVAVIRNNEPECFYRPTGHDKIGSADCRFAPNRPYNFFIYQQRFVMISVSIYTWLAWIKTPC